MEKNLTKLRRKDRRMEEADAHALLNKADIGFLATAVDGQPFVTPYSFWFDGKRIYFHGAKTGRSKENLLQNPQVCLTVAQQGRYLPAKRAMDFSVEFNSVMVFGTARRVIADKEKTYALQGLLDKYFPHLKSEEDYEPIIDRDLAITGVYAIDIESMSGKSKSEPHHPTEGKLRAFHRNNEVQSSNT